MNITRKKFDSLPYVGEGTEGIVRKLDDRYAVKEMYESEFPDEKKKSINVQCSLNNPSFVFPTDLLYFDGEYRGYVQLLIDDSKKPTVKDLNELKKTMEMIKELENNFHCLTPRRLLAHDLAVKNSIYYNGRIYVIDTSRYTLEEDTHYALVERENKRLLNYFLIQLLFLEGTDLSIYDFEEVVSKFSSSLQNLYGDMYGSVNLYFAPPSDFSKFLTNLTNELKADDLTDLQQKILSLYK